MHYFFNLDNSSIYVVLIFKQNKKSALKFFNSFKKYACDANVLNLHNNIYMSSFKKQVI